MTTETVKTLTDVQELIQNDLICILDGNNQPLIDHACQAVVDRFKQLKQSSHTHYVKLSNGETVILEERRDGLSIEVRHEKQHHT